MDASKAQKVRSPNLATVRVIAKSHNYRKTYLWEGKKLLFNQINKCNIAAWSEPRLNLSPIWESSIKGFSLHPTEYCQSRGGNFSRSSSSIKWPGHYGQECRFKRGKVILSFHKIKKRVPIETRTCLATIHETMDKARSHFGHSKK